MSVKENPDREKKKRPTTIIQTRRASFRGIENKTHCLEQRKLIIGYSPASMSEIFIDAPVRVLRHLSRDVMESELLTPSSCTTTVHFKTTNLVTNNRQGVLNLWPFEVKSI